MALNHLNIRVAALVTVATTLFFWKAHGYIVKTKDSEFDAIWEPTIKQEDFDGIPLPESTDVQPVTQMTPAIVKIGQRYGVPFTAQSLGKKKHKPGKKDDFMDHVMGASLMSGGTLISLGTLAMIAMASKALLLAFGAIVLTCLSSGWSGGAHKLGSASTVYEVIAKPQITHGHSHSAEVHHEPFSSQPPTSFNDFGFGHR